MDTTFFSLTNLATLLLSLLLILYTGSLIKKERKTYGKQLVLVFFWGLIICILAAFRDGYGFSSDSIISMTGTASTLFSLLGLSLVIAVVSLIFNKKVTYQRKVLFFMTVIFLFKFVLMEIIRYVVIL